MAILVSQNNAPSTYTFGTPDVDNAFFGLATQAETINFNGTGSLKIFDVSAGDTLNLAGIVPSSANPVSISVSGNVVTLTTGSVANNNLVTYTLGSFNAAESAIINFANQSITISAVVDSTAPTIVNYSYTSTQTGTATTAISDTPTAIVFDDTAPTVTSFSSTTANGSYKAGSQINVTATTSEAVKQSDTIVATLDTGETVTLTAATAGTSLIGTYTVGASKTSADLTVASFTTTATDLVGNALSTTMPAPANNIANNSAIIIDTTAPTVTITTPATTNDTTPVIGGTSEPNATVTVTIGTQTFNTNADATTGAWAVGVTSPLANGNHTVSVTAVDLAGNPTAAATTQTLVIDTAAKATATPVENGSVLTNGVNATEASGNIVITAGLGNTDTWAKAGDTIELLLNGVSIDSDSATVGVQPVTHTLDANDIAAKSYDFTIAGSLLGNDGTKLLSTKVSTFNTIPSSPLTVVVDKTLPTLPNVAITSNNANPTLAKVGDTVTLSFTADEALGATPTATILGQIATVTKGTGNTYTATYTVANTDTEGAATFAINFADVAGNAGAAVTTVTNASVVSVDRTAPTLTISSDKTAFKIGETATVTFTFSEDPGSTFAWDAANQTGDISVTGGTLGAISGSGLTRTATFTPTAATNGLTGAISVDVTKFKDAAGNDNTVASNTLNLTGDTLAPNTPIINSVATDDVVNNGEKANVVISGTAENNSSVAITWAGTTQTVTADSTTGIWTTTFTTAPADGSTTLSVIATDSAGNASLAATKNILVDTVLPTANFAAATDDVGSVKGVLVSGKTTDDTALVLSGTNEIGATVDVYNGANKLGAATVTGTTWSYTATIENGTTYNFNVKETDTAGNISAATTDFVVTGDTTPPIANFTAATDNVGAVQGALTTGGTTDDPILVLSGTNEAGSTVNVYDGTTLLGAATVSSTGWTFDATIANARTYNFNVKETDAAGNTSAATADFVVTGDNIAPITSATLVTITSNALTNDTTPVITGTAEAGSEVTAVIAGATYKVTATGGNWSVDTGSATATSGTLNIVANATNNVSVTAKDAAGNTSAAVTQSLVVDTTPPTVTIESNVPAVKIGETATVTFTFSETPVGFAAGDITTIGGTLTGLAVNPANDKVYTALFTPAADTASANASITVAANSYTDAALNDGGAGTTPTIAIDTVAPTVTAFSSTKTDGSYKATTVIDISATISEAVKQNDTITVTLDTGANVTLTAASAGTTLTGNYTVASGQTSSDLNVVHFTTNATDIAGNALVTTLPASNLANNKAIVIDTTAPTVTLSSSVPTLKIAETAVITATFSEIPVGFTVDDLVSENGVFSNFTVTSDPKIYTATFTPTADSAATDSNITIATGSYTDLAGNNGVAGAKPALKMDMIAPTVSITSAAFSNSTTPTIYGTTEAGATVAVSVAGATYTTVANATGNWSVGITAALAISGTNGTNHNVSVVATDLAGNASTATTQTLNLNSDAKTPAIPVEKSGNTVLVNGVNAAEAGGTNNIVIHAGLGNSGAVSGNKIELLIDGNSFAEPVIYTLTGDDITATYYDFTISGTALGNDGTRLLTTLVLDGASIKSGTIESSALSVVVDKTAPTVAITSDKTAFKIGETATVTFTFSEDPGSTFAAEDVTLSGGTLGAISGSGLTRTATFTPTAATNGLTGAISVAAGAYDDAAGNPGTVSNTLTLTGDTLAPTTQDSALTTSVFKKGGVATAIASAEETGGAVWLAPAGTTTFVAGSTMTTAAGTATSINTPITEGTYKLFVIDAAGNVSTASTATVTVDNTAPAAPNAPAEKAGNTVLTNGVNAAEAANNIVITVALGTSGAVAGDTIELLKGGAAFSSPLTHVLTTDEVNTGSYDFTVAGSALTANATNSLTAKITDMAGNAGAASAALNVVVDTTAPSNQDTVLAASTSKKGGVAVTIPSAGETGGAVWLAPAGTTTFNAGATMTTADGTATSITTPATEGAYKLFIIDAAGNVSTASTATVTVDNTAPAAPTLAENGTTVLANAIWNSLELTSTIRVTLPTSGSLAAVGDSVSLLLDGAAFTSAKNHTLIAGDISAGYVDFTVLKTDLGADGASKVLSAKITDVAGNIGAAGTLSAFQLDTTAPAAPTVALTTDTGTLNNDGISKDGTITVAGFETTPAGATWQYWDVANSTWSTAQNTSTATFTLPAGTYAAGAVRVRQTDHAGNVSTEGSNATQIVIDTTAPDAPTVAINQAFKPSATFATGLTIASNERLWLAPAGTTVFTANATTITSGSVGAASVIVPTTAETTTGTGIYHLFLEDPAGNISPASTNVITVDNTAPTSTISGIAFIQKYGTDENVVRLTGTNFTDILTGTENSGTDVKGRLDFSKLLWDVDTAGSGDAAFALSAANDIEKVNVISATQLDIVLKASNALYSNAKFLTADSVVDTVAITAGFIADKASNAAASDAFTTDTAAIDTTKEFVMTLTGNGATDAPFVYVPKITLTAPATGNATFSGENLKATPTTLLSLSGVADGQTVTLNNLGKLTFVSASNTLNIAGASGATTDNVKIDLTGVKALKLTNDTANPANTEVVVMGGASAITLKTGSTDSIVLTSLTPASSAGALKIDTVSNFATDTDKVNFSASVFTALGTAASPVVNVDVNKIHVGITAPTNGTGKNIWINSGVISYDADGTWGTYSTTTKTFGASNNDGGSVALIQITGVTATDLYLV